MAVQVALSLALSVSDEGYGDRLSDAVVIAPPYMFQAVVEFRLRSHNMNERLHSWH